jgi:hypothetical protein
VQLRSSRLPIGNPATVSLVGVHARSIQNVNDYPEQEAEAAAKEEVPE